QFAFTRWGRRRGLEDATKGRAREAYLKLQARDPVVRHAWLFADQWVEESADEIEDEKFDFSKRDERIRKLRIAAMQEIWAERGFEGVTALVAGSAAPHVVGHSLGLCIARRNVRVDFLRRCLSITGDLERKVDGCIQGFLLSADDSARGAIL